MTMLAKHPFWLDGGYDREHVEACRHHPDHRWWVFRIGEVLDCDWSGRNPDQWMVICQGCYVPRCGHAWDDDPCLEPRHHPGVHRTAGGVAWPIGGSRP